MEPKYSFLLVLSLLLYYSIYLRDSSDYNMIMYELVLPNVSDYHHN